MTQNIAARRPGRPVSENPKTSKSGKGRQLSANIPLETKTALETEAVRTGRSVSQVTELWLESARAVRANGIASAGVEDLILAISRLHERVSAAVGHPDETRVGRSAVLSGIGALLQSAFPFTPRDNDEVELREVAASLGGAATALDQAISTRIATAAGQRIDDSWVAPETTPKSTAAQQVYHSPTLPNVLGATNGVRSFDHISTAHLVGYCQYRSDLLTVEAVDTLLAALGPLEAADASLAPFVSGLRTAAEVFRERLVPYEAKHAAARKRGGEIAASLTA